jgi:Helix-turn-helix domain
MPKKDTSTSRVAPGFYLYVASRTSSTLSSSNVFYWFASEQTGKTLLHLFSRAYSSEAGEPAFLSRSADELELSERILLDETLSWLDVYDDPDQGVYDPEPPKNTIVRAMYAKRARDWESQIMERIGRKSNGEGGTSPSLSREVPEGSVDELQMSAEDRRNSGLNLLFLLAQTYYKILECVISMASLCCALDLELNESYLWTITNLENLLANHGDLRDFPGTFEPVFPDLYPSTIRDHDWEDTVGPDVEQFLSTVQKYVRSKGVYSPEKGSPGWTFVELFRPSLNNAIERAVAYNEGMRKCARSTSAQCALRQIHQEDEQSENSSRSGSQQSQEFSRPSTTNADRPTVPEADQPPLNLRRWKMGTCGPDPAAKLRNAREYPVMTVKEVQALLRVSRSSVYRYLQEGRLQRPGLNQRPGKRSRTLICTSSVQKALETAD